MADPVAAPAAPVEAPSPSPAPSPSTSSSDSPAIVASIQGKLDAFNDSTPDPTPAPAPAPKPADDSKPNVGEPAKPAPAAEGGDKPTAGAGEKPIEAPAAAAPEASTLPAAYRRSAKAREWTDAEIDAFFTKDPELALRTLGKIHESRVQEVNQWAAMGRQARPQPSTPELVKPAVVAPTPTPAPELAALSPIDVKAMVAKYGNEALLTELTTPLNAAIAAVQPLLAQAKQQQAQAVQVQMETLGRMVEGYFTSKDMEPYKDVYGAIGNMTNPQLEARQKVLEMADALVAGASMQGRQLKVEEALALAHDATASDLKTKILRDQIAKSAQTRAQGLTLRPTNRGKSPLDRSGPPRDRQELVNRAEERLAAAFGG